MKYVKFTSDQDKKRCLSILTRLSQDEGFQFLMEHMLDETRRRAEGALVEINHDDLQLPVTQGVARSFKELIDICRSSREVLEKMSKNKPKAPTQL